MEIIKLNRPSSCVSSLVVRPQLRAVTATFKSGHVQTYCGINPGDIENLLGDSTVSIGKWINQVCKGLAVSEELQFN